MRFVFAALLLKVKIHMKLKKWFNVKVFIS